MKPIPCSTSAPSPLLGRLLLVLLPLCAVVQAQDFAYTTNADGITISRYTGPGGAATIPNRIGGLRVTSIGERAFLQSTNLTALVVPASVTSTGESAFAYCSSLAGVSFEGAAPGLGSEVFSYSDKLTIYYSPGTSGWGPTFAGRPTALDPKSPVLRQPRDRPPNR